MANVSEPKISSQLWMSNVKLDHASSTTQAALTPQGHFICNVWPKTLFHSFPSALLAYVISHTTRAHNQSRTLIRTHLCFTRGFSHAVFHTQNLYILLHTQIVTHDLFHTYSRPFPVWILSWDCFVKGKPHLIAFVRKEHSHMRQWQEAFATEAEGEWRSAYSDLSR